MKKKENMLDTIKKIWVLLHSKEKRLSVVVLFSALIMALAEISSIGSLFAFSHTLANTDESIESSAGHYISSIFSINTQYEYIFIVGIITLVLLVVRNLIVLSNIYIRNYFSNIVSSNISIRLLTSYHRQPWEFFLNNNTSVLRKNVLQEPVYLIGKYFSGVLNIISDVIIIITIVLMLYIYDAKATLIIACSLVLSYFFVYAMIRRYISSLGERRVLKQEGMYRAIDENLGGVREIKVFNKGKYFINEFSELTYEFYRTILLSSVVKAFSKPFLEVIIVGLMIVFVLFLIKKQEANIGELAGFLTLYGAAGYRMMPLFDRLLSSFAGLRFSAKSVDLITSDLKRNLTVKDLNEEGKFEFNHNIQLKNIHHKYTGYDEYSLRDINLNISKNNSIGIIGASGSGKTTIANILIGLLKPEQGELSVDGNLITDANIAMWKNNIGYVSQDIFLLDKTVTENIAFGVQTKDIDNEKVKNSAKISNIHEFIIDELPNGYNTLIGERGVRLSGGQKQRLAIARALYNDPDVLILDEATSALDGKTEQIVSEAIDKLAHKKTLIIIAHRFSTIKACEQIYVFKQGSIVANGTYEELEKNNKIFQSMNTN